MHEISLGRYSAAVESLSTSLAFAKEDARLNDQPTTVAVGGTFSVVLGSGYLGLARQLTGEDLGQAQYTEAINTFKAQLADEAKKGDAQFGIDQLEAVRERYVK